MHRLFGRLAFYLIVYNAIAFSTSYVDAYLPSIDDAFDLIWVMTYLTAAGLAARWHPSTGEDHAAKPRISRRAALLCFNLTMATLVMGSAALGLRIVDSSRIVGFVAVGLVLLSYAVRCALMQDAQEKNVRALRESNARYELVTLATNDVPWDRNLSDEQVSWNNNVYSLFGYQPGEVSADRNWWINNVHPDDRESILASVRILLTGNKNGWSGEYRFRRADGSYAFVLDRAYVVRETHGNPVRLIGSIQDLTVRKQAELEIDRARQAAEAAAQAKTDFLSNMSHEIRTPLNGVLGALELAGQTDLSPEQADLLTMAEESASTLMSVVNDVLDFSKIEANGLELERTEFDISDAVTEAMRTILIPAQRKQIDLSHFVASDVPRRISGDPARLKQILVNLLGNAVKFTEKGQVLLRVETGVPGASEVDLTFSVADTGIGIPEEKQQVIFQAFSQADNSITRRFGGTGLGLAIASKIVSLMQGRIWVESAVGRGSTFFFTAKFGALPSEMPLTVNQSFQPHSHRILVVDPQPASRTFVRDTLVTRGADVITADTASEALQILAVQPEGQRFALVVCDSHLPGMDGFELVEQIKQRLYDPPKVIMVLNSENYQSAVALCEHLGVAGHLIKPVKRSELLSTVDNTSELDGTSPVTHSPLPLNANSAALNILLAEDNLINQKVAMRMLQKMGHNVEVVENGKQALQKIRSRPFDLVLMDGHMPEMDGLAATRAIREWERIRSTHVPIIAMTAMAMEGDEQACLAAGMDAFISKPINIQLLKETIHQMMDAAGRDQPVNSANDSNLSY